MFGKNPKADVEAPETAPASTITPDAPKAVVEKPAPDESPAPAGKQPPRARRAAPPPEN